MNIKIRHGFETNSSSSHSLSYANKVDLARREFDLDEPIEIVGGEYGWGYEVLYSSEEKLNYLAVEADGNEYRTNLILGSIKRVLGDVEVKWDMTGYSYIDHQSSDVIWSFILEADNQEEFIDQVIFGDFQIIIDNDNH